MTSDNTAIVIASISAAVSLTVAVGGEWARRGLASRQAEQAKELQEAKLRADSANARYAEEAALRAQDAGSELSCGRSLWGRKPSGACWTTRIGRFEASMRSGVASEALTTANCESF